MKIKISLKVWRTKKDITQQELADSVDLSRQLDETSAIHQDITDLRDSVFFKYNNFGFIFSEKNGSVLSENFHVLFPRIWFCLYLIVFNVILPSQFPRFYLNLLHKFYMGNFRTISIKSN